MHDKYFSGLYWVKTRGQYAFRTQSKAFNLKQDNKNKLINKIYILKIPSIIESRKKSLKNGKLASSDSPSAISQNEPDPSVISKRSIDKSEELLQPPSKSIKT